MIFRLSVLLVRCRVRGIVWWVVMCGLWLLIRVMCSGVVGGVDICFCFSFVMLVGGFWCLFYSCVFVFDIGVNVKDECIVVILFGLC